MHVESLITHQNTSLRYACPLSGLNNSQDARPYVPVACIQPGKNQFSFRLQTRLTVRHARSTCQAAAGNVTAHRLTVLSFFTGGGARNERGVDLRDRDGTLPIRF